MCHPGHRTGFSFPALTCCVWILSCFALSTVCCQIELLPTLETVERARLTEPTTTLYTCLITSSISEYFWAEPFTLTAMSIVRATLPAFLPDILISVNHFLIPRFLESKTYIFHVLKFLKWGCVLHLKASENLCRKITMYD